MKLSDSEKKLAFQVKSYYKEMFFELKKNPNDFANMLNCLKKVEQASKIVFEIWRPYIQQLQDDLNTESSCGIFLRIKIRYHQHQLHAITREIEKIIYELGNDKSLKQDDLPISGFAYNENQSSDLFGTTTTKKEYKISFKDNTSIILHNLDDRMEVRRAQKEFESKIHHLNSYKKAV